MTSPIYFSFFFLLHNLQFVYLRIHSLLPVGTTSTTTTSLCVLLDYEYRSKTCVTTAADTYYVYVLPFVSCTLALRCLFF